VTEARLRRARTALFRFVGEDVYLAAAGRSDFDHLTGTAASAWRLLEAGPTIAELLRSLAEIYGTNPATIESEVRPFIEDLKRRAWVEASPS
jgi:hypothetical protein